MQDSRLISEYPAFIIKDLRCENNFDSSIRRSRDMFIIRYYYIKNF